MRTAPRLPVVLAVPAVLAFAGVLVLSEPPSKPRDEGRMIDFSRQRYYSLEAVREAFAEKGVQLRVASRFGGFVTLSDEPRPLDADALQVVVGPRTGEGSWGAKLEPYDERFGNVLVTYGGGDPEVAHRVDAAVAALR